jgi:undecaprenyl-phosphate galactose phosphotransferase
VFIVVGAVTGAYRRKLEGSWRDFVDTGRAVGVATLFIVFATFVGKTSHWFSRLTVVLFWICATVLVPLARLTARRLLARMRLDRLRALVLASDRESAEEAVRFCSQGSFPFEPCGLVLVGGGTLAGLGSGIPILGDLDQLPETAARTDAEAAVMAVPEASSARIRALAMCQRLFPTVVMTTPLHNVATADVELHTIGSRLVLELRHNHIDIVNRAVKRAFDIAFGSAVLVLLSPLYAAIGLVVKLDSPGPVFYRHRRIGRDGRVFHCLKFRTMYRNADSRLDEILRRDPQAAAEFAATFKLKNDPRITRIGRILRKTSLDEMPQFINVVAGEMSVVGPRPIVAEELVRYGDWAGNLLAVRPGVTGHWQVSGRNDTTYDERVALDMHYLRNWSLSEDIRIVFKTIGAILERANGAY